IILNDAGQKISAFNSNAKDNDPGDYHSVLLAIRESSSIVGMNGRVADEHLDMIDKALRGYFMMNRGNRMGSKAVFVPRLMEVLTSGGMARLLASLRNVTILPPSLENHRLDSEALYEALSNCESGLSDDNTYFCVGATKIMHMLCPKLFVMLDKNVGKACGYSAGQYNSFQAYWTVMNICHNELNEWIKEHGSSNTLLHLDPKPTSLTRIFDKCATMTTLGY
ncbi:hypothetical protein ACFLVK_02220, partial [Chloroflexota bacterium]